ncbi:hypothetical protein A6J33_006800 [Pantoea sp. FDAARGOS_194]|nr:hypothetical protein A6J33_006800 [Pantoea sp. FDAARGOS_194]
MAMLRKFSITTLPQALEIARYCTRIKRDTEHDHTFHLKFIALAEICAGCGALNALSWRFAPFWCHQKAVKHSFGANSPVWCSALATKECAQA